MTIFTVNTDLNPNNLAWRPLVYTYKATHEIFSNVHTIAKFCQVDFNFELPSVILAWHSEKFLIKY